MIIAAFAFYSEYRDMKRQSDFEEIQKALQLFDPNKQDGCVHSAEVIKLILRCERHWGFKIQEFKIGDKQIMDKDDLLKKAFDASERAERYYGASGIMNNAKNTVALYMLKR